jgi:hypothetical protein
MVMIPRKLLEQTLLTLALMTTPAFGAQCRSDQAFSAGLVGKDMNAGCDGRNYRIDYELGRQLRLLRAEKNELEATQRKGLSDDVGRLTRVRLQRLDREVAEIEGIARIRGLLPRLPE